MESKAIPAKLTRSAVEIRLLTEADAAAWWQLRHVALKTEPHSFVETPEEHLAKSVESTQDYFRSFNADNFIVGAFDEGELAGMAGFYRQKHSKFHHKGHVWGVYVRGTSRRKGIARQMLDEIVRRAGKSPGIEQITLTVAATQATARELYLSFGFTTYGVEPRSLKIGGEHVDDELMVLFLNSK
jgi:ribosomal protein S18 acetylase RimI-like enzyme